MHILLAGHGNAQRRLVPVAQALRNEGGVVVSGFYGKDFPYARMSLSSARFVLLGLSRESREMSSDAHAHEELLLSHIKGLTDPLPCGVLCDEDGHVSAPYLTKYGGPLMRLVFADSAIPAIFEDFEKGPIDPQAIAGVLRKFLKSAPARSAATI